jgi:hypothetical protein
MREQFIADIEFNISSGAEDDQARGDAKRHLDDGCPEQQKSIAGDGVGAVDFARPDGFDAQLEQPGNGQGETAADDDQQGATDKLQAVTEKVTPDEAGGGNGFPRAESRMGDG